MHTLKITYRPDNYPNWLPWIDFEDQFVPIGDPGSLGTAGLPNAKPGFAPRTSFGKPPDSPDELQTQRNLRRGFNFQVRFQGTGFVVLDRFRLHGQRLVERSRARIK